MDQSTALHTAYKRTERAYRVSESRAGAVVALVLVPVGVSLDYYVYPSHFDLFLGLRLLCDLAIAIILGLHFTQTGQRSIPVLTFLWLFAVQVMICYMIYAADGYASSYYAGLNLCVLAVGILLPTSVPETVLFCLATLALYLTACFLNTAGPVEFSVLFNNLYFLTLTGIISITAVSLNTRRRFTEFRLSWELDNRNKQLAELDRLKSQFFANVSHELRTPLTLIIAPLQDVLDSGRPLPEPVHNVLRIARDNALRLLKLVNDLLEVIRLEEGKADLEQRPIWIDHLLSAITDSITHLAEARGIRVIKQLGMPDTLVQGDYSALEKVFLNLLTNAIKFTEPGGSITVRTRRAGDRLAIDVRDTGIGISERDLPHVFDRFRQADSSSTRKYQGTGLGLALVKELTERHGGYVQAISQVGVGTTMTVVLPTLQASALRPRGESEPNGPDPLANIFRMAERSVGLPGSLPAAEESAEAPPEDARATVLVVEDEPDMRRYLVEVLSAQHRVLQAGDGRVGLEMARRRRPDLMVLDLMIPELDGLEVCRLLKADPATRGIKIMLLTARVDEPAKLAALDNGADDFLTKPFSSVEVKTRLRNLHQTAALERDLQERNARLEAAMTDLKRTQGQLIQSEKLNALGSLAAGLLHEVNNPLNFSLTALQILRRDPALQDEDLADMLNDIDEGMQRIRNIVSDLRAFAYPSEGDHQPFELADAVESALHFTRHEHGGTQVENRVPAGARVQGSRSHVVQVLINLVSNGLKAIHGTGRPGRIVVDGDLRGERFLVRVRDNGVGMDEATLARVFDPFFTTRDVGQGMGLGLSICHTIVGNHGGRLAAESKPGVGTEFSFDLPLAGPEPSALPPELAGGEG